MSEEVGQTLVKVQINVSKPFYALLEKFVNSRGYISVSELAREVLRNKVQQECPELYEECLKVS